MKHKVIGIVGLIGSGKGSIGSYLSEKHGYRQVSFAETLKDAVSAIFGWPRDMVEGATAESRAWREIPDEYWTQKLGRLTTPRSVLQNIGTDVLRAHFHQDIWIHSLGKKLLNTDEKVVITDVRFGNEVKMMYECGGEVWWVRRPPEPTWLFTAQEDKRAMPVVYPEVHSSEYEWMGHGTYVDIPNIGSLDDLHRQVDRCLER